jgi:hypothetical protein
MTCVHDHGRLAGQTLFDPADDRRARPRIDGRLRVRERDDERVADAHVERPMRFVVLQVATTHEFFEDRRHGPPRRFEDRFAIFGQRTGHVFEQAAARDVRHRFHARDVLNRTHGLEIRRVRCEQRIEIGLSRARSRKRIVPFALGDQRARERVAVGVQTDRG